MIAVGHRITEAEKDTPFIRELLAFLSAIADEQTTIYNAESWRARGEEYGNEAAVRYVLTMDGGTLDMLLNHYLTHAPWTDMVEKAWGEFLQRYGMWYAQGTAWMLYIYDAAEMDRAAGIVA